MLNLPLKKLQDGSGVPLVFLHGFLGSSQDFSQVIAYLPGRLCYGADLFEKEPPPNPIFYQDLPPCRLVGYSMGGRIAMQWALKNPCRIHSLVLLSAHYGLSDPEERKQRQTFDRTWVNRLLTRPFDEFLKDWYDQPVFASLKKKPNLLREIAMTRKSDDPFLLAKTLLCYSLASSPCCREELQTFQQPLLILFGEEDEKFTMLYESWPQARQIPHAGHCLLFENPLAIAQLL